jgi:hypothetical protein
MREESKKELVGRLESIAGACAVTIVSVMKITLDLRRYWEEVKKEEGGYELREEYAYPILLGVLFSEYSDKAIEKIYVLAGGLASTIEFLSGEKVNWESLYDKALEIPVAREYLREMGRLDWGDDDEGGLGSEIIKWIEEPLDKREEGE